MKYEIDITDDIIPPGVRPIAFRRPKQGERYAYQDQADWDDENCGVCFAGNDLDSVELIIEPIPESPLVATAARKLEEYLTAIGVSVRSTGHDQRSTIHIYLFHKKDLKCVPEMFGGFKVESAVMGEVRAL